LHRDIVDKGLSWSTGTVGLKNSVSRSKRSVCPSTSCSALSSNLHPCRGISSLISLSVLTSKDIIMSSWPAPAYPPPRRSRSRSPPRGGHPRPQYPDTGYPPDQHRGGGGWDPHERDRERAWLEYERDRTAYDHTRRRSRSPPPDDSMKFSLYFIS
jgi:hypothetical protein